MFTEKQRLLLSIFLLIMGIVLHKIYLHMCVPPFDIGKLFGIIGIVYIGGHFILKIAEKKD